MKMDYHGISDIVTEKTDKDESQEDCRQSEIKSRCCGYRCDYYDRILTKLDSSILQLRNKDPEQMSSALP